MDEEQKLNSIMEPLRTLVLTGNSLNGDKDAYVLTHVLKFSSVERQETFSALKHKEKLQKKKPNCTENSETSHFTRIRDPTGGSTIEGYFEKNLTIDYAESGVKDIEKHFADVIKLVEEGKGKEILYSLVAASQLSSVSLEGIVFCLVLVIKKAKDVNIVSEGYTYVRQICKNTQLLMLFIECCKLYTVANSKCSGWGRGMKRAIKNWYLKWEPRELALEVTRNPSAYTWSHKDVLKLAHINLKELPLGKCGHSLVLHYIFSGLESTKKKYEDEKNAAELLQLLDVLTDGAKEITNSHIIIERGKNIINSSGSVTLNDFPLQALSDVKACKHDENKLSDSASKAKIWKYKAQPNPDPSKKVKVNTPRPREINELFDVMSNVITKGVQSLSKNSKKHPVVFIDFVPEMENFITAVPEDPISKEVRATQALSYILLSMGTTNLKSLIPLLFEVIDKFQDSSNAFTFSGLQSSFNKLARQSTVKIVTNAAIDIAVGMESATALLIYWQLTEDIVKEIFEWVKENKDSDSSKKLRLSCVAYAPLHSSSDK
ncbi:60 kDa SS-A/Ro ribonucleoprotein [Armadillidium vulgare]|nr:60 kDa SS-A/Ro ribonucleoprotein [Armadillidium vulgare]